MQGDYRVWNQGPLPLPTSNLHQCDCEYIFSSSFICVIYAGLSCRRLSPKSFRRHLSTINCPLNTLCSHVYHCILADWVLHWMVHWKPMHYLLCLPKQGLIERYNGGGTVSCSKPMHIVECGVDTCHVS